MDRKGAFATTVSWMVTIYLIAATVSVHRAASTPADEAAVKVLGVLTGAVGIVAFCLLIRWSEAGVGDEAVRAEAGPADAPNVHQ